VDEFAFLMLLTNEILAIATLVFFLIIVLSYYGVAVYRIVSVRNLFLDIPNERSSHTEPIPHGAGLVIVMICLTSYVPLSIVFLGSFSWGYILGASLIALISFLDDLFSIPAIIRLLVQFIAAAVLIADVDTWHGVSMLGGISLGNWGYLITFVWIVWMVNSYNFMDGIDGLAGLQAVIAGLGWMLLCGILGIPSLFLFSGVIAAASLGFLFHNWKPANIFMGDVGSAFLGFTFAALPLLARVTNQSKSWDLLPIAALLFVWFFLFDSVITLLRRAVRGEKIWVAHREHLFQRLVHSGYTHRRVTLIYGILASLLCLSVLASVEFREDIGLAMFPVVLILTTILLFVVYRRKVLR
jgi:UDP-N-acetylmuramyl pentapeptide phosphotransferase/UDP-N-acetylglucosamine-1-phosphate transferase